MSEGRIVSGGEIAFLDGHGYCPVFFDDRGTVLLGHGMLGAEHPQLVSPSRESAGTVRVACSAQKMSMKGGVSRPEGSQVVRLRLRSDEAGKGAAAFVLRACTLNRRHRLNRLSQGHDLADGVNADSDDEEADLGH